MCFTSLQQRGHLETAPPFTVPCEGLCAYYFSLLLININDTNSYLFRQIRCKSFLLCKHFLILCLSQCLENVLIVMVETKVSSYAEVQSRVSFYQNPSSKYNDLCFCMEYTFIALNVRNYMLIQ